MPPGGKKRNFTRKAEEKTVYNKKESTQKYSERQSSNKNSSKEAELIEDVSSETQGEEKTLHENNWDRYEEPVEDVHADVPRGGDFEVLLSYSSGAGSQLKLQDEREWDEFKLDAKNLVLDVSRLAKVLKCIPFHKRLNIPESVFSPLQIQQFEKSAHANASSFTEITELPRLTSEEVLEKSECTVESTGEYYVDDGAAESDIHSDSATVKAPVIEEKTVSLIESLSSCLTAKAVIFSDADVKEEEIDQPAAENDDLGFLLSLTKPPDKENEAQPEEKPKMLAKSNVDEWLSSILDD